MSRPYNNRRTPNTKFKFHKKVDKQIIERIDTDDLDRMLSKGQIQTYATVVYTLMDCLHEQCKLGDPNPLSEYQLAALLHPFKKWGTEATSVLYQFLRSENVPLPRPRMARDIDVQALAGVDGETLEQCVEAGDFELAKLIYTDLTLIADNKRTDGHREFVDLYNQCVRK